LPHSISFPTRQHFERCIFCIPLRNHTKRNPLFAFSSEALRSRVGNTKRGNALRSSARYRPTEILRFRLNDRFAALQIDVKHPGVGILRRLTRSRLTLKALPELYRHRFVTLTSFPADVKKYSTTPSVPASSVANKALQKQSGGEGQRDCGAATCQRPNHGAYPCGRATAPVQRRCACRRATNRAICDIHGNPCTRL